MKLRRRKRGKNIIHFQKSLEELASDLKTSRQDLQKRVEQYDGNCSVTERNEFNLAKTAKPPPMSALTINVNSRLQI